MGFGNSVLQKETSHVMCMLPLLARLSFTELSFPLTCILSDVPGFFFFFVHATLKFSVGPGLRGTVSLGSLFSASIILIFFFFSFSCLVLKF